LVDGASNAFTFADSFDQLHDRELSTQTVAFRSAVVLLTEFRGNFAGALVKGGIA
jgi:hypothetical protein